MSHYATLDNEDQQTLSIDIINQEIKSVVNSLKPYKAPSPDGLHPFFYRKFWDETKEN